MPSPDDHPPDQPEVDPSSVFAPSSPATLAPRRRPGTLMVAAIVTVVLGLALVTARLVATRDDGNDNATTSTATTRASLDVTAPKGFRVVKNDDARFAIAIPKKWRDFDLAKHDIRSIQATLKKKDPQLVATLDQVKRVSKIGGVLFAIEPQPGPFSHNLNVIRIAEKLDLEGSRRTFAAQLKSAGAKKLRFTEVVLPGGAALLSTYELAHRLPDGKTQPVEVRQYYVPAHNATWIVTFSTIDIAKDGRIFDRVIASFRVDRA